MSVYFVYRSHYEGPACKHFKRFDDSSVLDWFQNRWMVLADAEEAFARVKKEMGCYPYHFESLFEAIAEYGLPVPVTEHQLHACLQQHLSVEGAVECRPHCLQVLTNDDEVEMAYYIFDDHYLERHPDRAAFLMQEGWQLPGGQGESGLYPRATTQRLLPRGQGTGATYCVFLAYYDSGNLTDIEAAKQVRGVRLPQFSHYLATNQTHSEWPFELRLLRSQLFGEPSRITKGERSFLAALAEHPDDSANWAVYSDWLEERGRPSSGHTVLTSALHAVARYPVATMCNRLNLGDFGFGSLPEAREQLKALVKDVEGSFSQDPSLSRVAVQDHVAQLCLHTDRWGERDLYHHWIFFDDLWAGAHPDLARSILRYAQRWDVL